MVFVVRFQQLRELSQGFAHRVSWYLPLVEGEAHFCRRALETTIPHSRLAWTIIVCISKHQSTSGLGEPWLEVKLANLVHQTGRQPCLAVLLACMLFRRHLPWKVNRAYEARLRAE